MGRRKPRSSSAWLGLRAVYKLLDADDLDGALDELLILRRRHPMNLEVLELLGDVSNDLEDMPAFELACEGLVERGSAEPSAWSSASSVP